MTKEKKAVKREIEFVTHDGRGGGEEKRRPHTEIQWYVNVETNEI